MSEETKTATKEEKTNHIGLTKDQYTGLASTLCAGCGHDSITRHITSAFFEMGIKPQNVIKLSGIGCSSKTPAYFLNLAHGFNSVHGRMPSVTTGAVLANRTLEAIGVSGDGDTASIGMGQFIHMIRRNVDCTYIVENNGVYGLTKGQFSATADPGSILKKGEVNDYPDIDLCSLAILLGCNYVGRSFSGDMNQMVPLTKAGIAHRGTAFLDVISPCVTFNNHEGSTKSFLNVKKNDIAIHEIGFHPYFETPEVDLKAGEERQVELPDGSVISLKKIGKDHDPRDSVAALTLISESKAKGQILTGLLYANPEANVPFLNRMKICEKPLVYQNEEECRLSKKDFESIQNRLR